MRATTLALACSMLLGCLGHQSGPARAQEAATEVNVHSRFGRMELAAARVAPAARAAFLQRRMAWGKDVRLADYELTGFQMNGETEAESWVRVAWYRADQTTLRVTTLKQSWRDFKGDWQLVDEGRADGDLGLFGEPAPSAPASGPKPAHFPVIRLGAPSPLGGGDADLPAPPDAAAAAGGDDADPPAPADAAAASRPREEDR